MLQEILSSLSLKTRALLALALFLAVVFAAAWGLSPYRDGETSLFPCEIEYDDWVSPEEAGFLWLVRAITTAVKTFFRWLARGITTAAIVFFVDVPDSFTGDYSLHPCEVEDPPGPRRMPFVVVPDDLAIDFLNNSQALQAEVAMHKSKTQSALDALAKAFDDFHKQLFDKNLELYSQAQESAEEITALETKHAKQQQVAAAEIAALKTEHAKQQQVYVAEIAALRKQLEEKATSSDTTTNDTKKPDTTKSGSSAPTEGQKTPKITVKLPEVDNRTVTTGKWHHLEDGVWFEDPQTVHEPKEEAYITKTCWGRDTPSVMQDWSTSSWASVANTSVQVAWLPTRRGRRGGAAAKHRYKQKAGK